MADSDDCGKGDVDDKDGDGGGDEWRSACRDGYYTPARAFYCDPQSGEACSWSTRFEPGMRVEHGVHGFGTLCGIVDAAVGGGVKGAFGPDTSTSDCSTMPEHVGLQHLLLQPTDR